MLSKNPSTVVRRTLAASTLAATLCVSMTANAAVVFQFDFTGTFLTDPNGAAEQAAVIAAGNLYTAQFAQYFSNSAVVELAAFGFDNIASNNLANAGAFSDFASSQTPGLGIQEVISTIQTGVNPFGPGPVGVLNINFAYPFQLDPNAPVSDTQFDFYNVLQHEFTHAVGFSSSLPLNGTGNGDFQNQYLLYDTFLADAAGDKLLNANLTPNQTALALARTTGVFFTGANAEAAYGGQPVPLYAATTPDDSDSASHTDPILLPLDLMNPGLGTGPAPAMRMLSAIDVGLLTDLGYTPVSAQTAVPEPASYSMLLVGMAFCGVLGWQRRRNQTNG